MVVALSGHQVQAAGTQFYPFFLALDSGYLPAEMILWVRVVFYLTLLHWGPIRLLLLGLALVPA